MEYLLPAEDKDAEAFKADQEKLLQGRVKGLKDVVEVKFHAEEASEKKVNGDSRERWLCPITNKVLGAGVKAVYVVPCGHAFAELALKEISETKCLQVRIGGCWVRLLLIISQCGEPYSTDNVVSILPLAPSERERLSKRNETLKEQGLTHSLKKGSGSSKKKRKKEALEAEGPIDVLSSKALSKSSSGVSASRNGIKNAATASLTARVLAEEQEKAKRRKLGGSQSLKSLFSSGPKGPQKDGDFMTRGHSVAAETSR